MRRVTPERAGSVLLPVEFGRLRSGILALAGGGLAGGTLVLLGAADRTSWGAGQWLMGSFALVLGGLVLIASARQLLSPVRMITATDRGLLLHLDGSRYVRTGCLVRWSDVEELSLDTVDGWQGADRRRFKTIVVALRSGAPPVPDTANYGPAGPERSVRIDASNGSLRGEELLHGLETLHRRYG